jgi:2-furoyl-CoA dehydrogenase FAD binding subunit
LKPAPFEMRRPTQVEEVLTLLSEFGGDARLLAGGQSLVPMMNLRIAAPQTIIDLNKVAGLSGIRLDGSWIRIGAMTRQQELVAHPLVHAHAPLLARAVPFIGHLQTRSRGTVGGSMAHADPSAELPVTMVALGAVVRLRTSSSEREVDAREFFQDALLTALRPGELLVEIAVPRAPENARAVFLEISRRHGDFAIASSAVQLVPGGRGTTTLTAAVGGVTSVPHLCTRLCAAFASRGFRSKDINSLVEEELEGLTPMEDAAVDGAYRRRAAAAVLGDCLREVMT